MAQVSWVLVRRCIDLLLVGHLINTFEACTSIAAAARIFMQLPELSQIGIITVVVFLAGGFAELIVGIINTAVNQARARKPIKNTVA